MGEVEFVDIRISCDLYKKSDKFMAFGTEHSLVYRIASHGTKSEDTAVKKIMFQ